MSPEQGSGLTSGTLVRAHSGSVGRWWQGPGRRCYAPRGGGGGSAVAKRPILRHVSWVVKWKVGCEAKRSKRRREAFLLERRGECWCHLWKCRGKQMARRASEIVSSGLALISLHSYTSKRRHLYTQTRKVHTCIMQSSGPQPCWHQGPVSWKAIFSVVNMSEGSPAGLTLTTSCCAARFLKGHGPSGHSPGVENP